MTHHCLLDCWLDKPKNETEEQILNQLPMDLTTRPTRIGFDLDQVWMWKEIPKEDSNIYRTIVHFKTGQIYNINTNFDLFCDLMKSYKP